MCNSSHTSQHYFGLKFCRCVKKWPFFWHQHLRYDCTGCPGKSTPKIGPLFWHHYLNNVVKQDAIWTPCMLKTYILYRDNKCNLNVTTVGNFDLRCDWGTTPHQVRIRSILSLSYRENKSICLNKILSWNKCYCQRHDRYEFNKYFLFNPICHRNRCFM